MLHSWMHLKIKSLPNLNYNTLDLILLAWIPLFYHKSTFFFNGHAVYEFSKTKNFKYNMRKIKLIIYKDEFPVMICQQNAPRTLWSWLCVHYRIKQQRIIRSLTFTALLSLCKVIIHITFLQKEIMKVFNLLSKYIHSNLTVSL